LNPLERASSCQEWAATALKPDIAVGIQLTAMLFFAANHIVPAWCVEGDSTRVNIGRHE
jgi:hypothetical protein